MTGTSNNPAIVVAHPFGGVKEQTAGLYARKLAEKGFITLAFDASHTGESGGEPRYLEDPTDRVEGFRSAVHYLTTLPYVAENRIGALGVCAGGGYAISATQTESRIKAVAAISMWDMGDATRRGLGRTMTEADRVKLLQEVAEQRTKEARGGSVRYGTQVADTPDQIDHTFTINREGHEYYRTPRGQHPNSVNRFIFTSIDKLMAFYPFSQIETISPRPILLIAGEKADTLYYSQEAYEKAAQPKELVVLPGGSHVDLYDRPEYVNPAVDKLASFYGQHL